MRWIVLVTFVAGVGCGEGGGEAEDIATSDETWEICNAAKKQHVACIDVYAECAYKETQECADRFVPCNTMEPARDCLRRRGCDLQAEKWRCEDPDSGSTGIVSCSTQCNGFDFTCHMACIDRIECYITYCSTNQGIEMVPAGRPSP
jgi:hypothetical protein